MARAARARRRVALLVVAVSTLLAACSEPEQPPALSAASGEDTIAVDSAAASSALKACDVISVAELEGILEVELEPARTISDYAGDSKCEWNLPGDAQRGVSISLRRLDDLAIYRNVPGGINALGLGDEAIWNATYGQLAVRRGGTVLSIALLVEEPQRTHAQRIARIALEKI